MILYHPMKGRFLGYQKEIDATGFTNWHTWDGESGIMPPTHWMPLPPAPIAAAPSGEKL